MPQPANCTMQMRIDTGSGPGSILTGASGGQTILASSVVYFSAQSYAGWGSPAAVYEFAAGRYPKTWACPAGWTDDGNGNYQYVVNASTGYTPPAVIFPSTGQVNAGLWGTWLPRLRVPSAGLVDETVGLEIKSPVLALHETAAGEEAQFGGATRGYAGPEQSNLRKLDVAGGVGSVGATAPITSTGGPAPTIGITAASGGAAGSMSSAHYSLVNAATSAATASTLGLRDNTGKLFCVGYDAGAAKITAVADPTAGSQEAATAHYVDAATVLLVPKTRNWIAGAGLTGGGDGTADRTFNVIANADGSMVVNVDDIQVGVLASDAQHGVRGGGTQHAVAIAGGAAGFMSGADKTKLDGIPTGSAALSALSPSLFLPTGLSGATSNGLKIRLFDNPSGSGVGYVLTFSSCVIHPGSGSMVADAANHTSIRLERYTTGTPDSAESDFGIWDSFAQGGLTAMTPSAFVVSGGGGSISVAPGQSVYLHFIVVGAGIHTDIPSGTSIHLG